MNKFQQNLIHALAAVALAILAWPASAHFGGFTYEATVNDYFVDIGANMLELKAGEPILFDYSLYKTSDPNDLADFDNVYVTVGDKDSVQLSTFIYRPEGMLTVFSYIFPRAGQYEMSARFQKGGQVLAEASFPLEVRSGGLDANVVKIGLPPQVIGIIIGFAISRMMGKRGLGLPDK